MKLLKHLSLAIVALSAVFTSCTTETFETLKQASVAISDVESATTSTITATFTPDAACASYMYAIGKSDDRDVFLLGGLEGTQTATGSMDVTFEGLEADTEYTIYALAYDASQVEGSVASYAIRSYNALCEVTIQYAGVNTAGVGIVTNSSVSRVDYALSTPGRSADFKSGDMNDIKSVTEINSMATNYYDLDADTDYAFYYMFYDRSGGVSAVYELPFATGNTEDSPYVEFTMGDINIFEGNYTFTPNDKCSKYYFMVDAADTYSQIFNGEGYAGDIYNMMLNWAGEDWGVYTATETLDFSLQTVELNSSVDMEFYVLACDLDGNPAAVQAFIFSTPTGEATGVAAIEKIEEIEITSYSSKFEITPNEHTFGTFYALFTKSSYDTYWSTDIDALQEQMYSDYTQQVLYDHDPVWQVGNEPFIYEEAYGLSANTSYYVVAIPISGEGLDIGGWGDVELYEFTTAAI